MWGSSKTSRVAGYRDLDTDRLLAPEPPRSRGSQLVTVVVSVLCVSCLLGLVTGAWISATSPLLVTLLGLPQLGTAFGRLTAVRGVAALASPPLAAMMAEHMGMPLLPLYLSSALFAASTLLFSIAVLVYDRKMKKFSLYEQI